MKNDLSIPVVWPLHDIGVNISGVTSLQGLGHAGIIIVDGDTGRASYSEYGRYPDENGVMQMGLIRGRELGNVSINHDQISSSDLQHLLSEFPKEKGQAWGSVFESDPDGFQRAMEYINDPKKIL